MTSKHPKPESYGIDIGDLILWNPMVPGSSPGLILSLTDEDGKVVVYQGGEVHTVSWNQLRPIYKIDGSKVTYENKKINI